MIETGIKAKKAAQSASLLSTELKNKVLKDLKIKLLQAKDEIFQANEVDFKNAKENGLKEAMLDRLTINEIYLQNLLSGLDAVLSLEDPVNKILDKKILENGLELIKFSVPLGVVGIIYEARPNVTIDAFALNLKIGNACILRGGKEAIETNKVFEKIIRQTLAQNKIDENMMQLIKDTTRKSSNELMKMNQYVDVLIPRGSKELIAAVLQNSTIPVIETGAGNCHIYVDDSADLAQALKIIENAKTQRPSVCNALESLVIHKDIANIFLNTLVESLKNVEFYGDEEAQKIHPNILKASSEDFYKEYLDLKLSIKIVNNIHEAIEHINIHHSHHSDAILTKNKENAELFTQLIDSAVVYINASTRFTDGFVFALGAEIGISTQKLHARGPMGLEALTTYKYIVKGNGQIR